MTPAIGLALREENRPVLDEPALDAVEILFERADDPLRVRPHLGDQPVGYVSVHALELSVASPAPPRRAYLDALREVAEEHGAAAVSDHLGFTRGRDDGAGLGHFAPPPFDEDALRVVARNVAAIRDGLGRFPFFLENITYDFRFRGPMTEAEFLREVLGRTGCGWLLDVTNLYANARNFGFDAVELLEQVVPVAGRIQMHLSGGMMDPDTGRYFDTHSEPVPESVWELYREALRLGRGRVEAVFLERDANFPDETGWRDEVRRARRVAAEVEAQP